MDINSNELIIIKRQFKIVPDLASEGDEPLETTLLLKALEFIKSMPEGWCIIESEVWFKVKRVPIRISFPNSEILSLDTEKAENKIRRLIREQMYKEYGQEADS